MHSERIKPHKVRIHIEIRLGIECPVRIVEIHIRGDRKHTAVTKVLHERSACPVPRKYGFSDASKAVRPAALNFVLKDLPRLRKEDAPDACLPASENIALPCIPDVEKISRPYSNLRSSLPKKAAVIFQLPVLTGNENLLISCNPAFCKDLPDRLLLQIHIRNKYDTFPDCLGELKKLTAAPADTAEPDLKLFLQFPDPVCRLLPDPVVLRDKSIDLFQGDIFPPVLRTVIFPGQCLPFFSDLRKGNKGTQKFLCLRIQEHKDVRRIIEGPYHERIKNIKAYVWLPALTNFSLYVIQAAVPGSLNTLKKIVLPGPTPSPGNTPGNIQISAVFEPLKDF